MDLREQRRVFDARRENIYDAALLTFHGVNGFDVYNCSIPFVWNGQEFMYGRVERRDEWARSWVCLFRKVGKDAYALTQTMPYQLEDPYIQMFGEELVLGGTHVRKKANEQIDTYYGYFYRGTDLADMHYFATGPDYMKDIRLCPLKDGRIGVFSRPRSAKIQAKYGSGSVVGFTVIRSLDDLTAEVIENAPVIEHLFGENEWGGCNQCYLLRDGRIGVIGHKCYHEMCEGVRLAIYLNVAFIFDTQSHTVTTPNVIATRKSYPQCPAKRPELIDCAFTSGIVLRDDGLVDLYSGVGDCCEGRVTINNPFPGLL